MSILTIRELQASIQRTQILKGVNLDVKEGETVGLIGPNGSGKTTLFNCISGFVRAQSGELTFQGRDLLPLAPYERARLGIGRVFQNFGIFREMSLLENMLIALEGGIGITRSLIPFTGNLKRNKEKALSFLEDIGLAERAYQEAGSLSGGQLRLLELVRALAFGADLFLLDEPTAGVSPKMKGDVAQFISDLQQKHKTVLIIEHDMRFIQSFAERVVVLDEGKIVLDGAPDQVRSDPVLQEIYFGKAGESAS